MYAVGDAEVEFTIMSVAKPFVFALVCHVLGPEEVRERVGVNATGLPFNSLDGGRAERRRADEPDGELRRDRDDEPRPRRDVEAKWQFVRDGLSPFAGRALSLDEEVYESASQTNDRNQSIARLLRRCDRVYCPPAEAPSSTRGRAA